MLEHEDVRKVKLCDLLRVWLMQRFLCCQWGVESELTVLDKDIIRVLALQARVLHVLQLRLSVMREHLFQGS